MCIGNGQCAWRAAWVSGLLKNAMSAIYDMTCVKTYLHEADSLYFSAFGSFAVTCQCMKRGLAGVRSFGGQRCCLNAAKIVSPFKETELGPEEEESRPHQHSGSGQTLYTMCGTTKRRRWRRK